MTQSVVTVNVLAPVQNAARRTETTAMSIPQPKPKDSLGPKTTANGVERGTGKILPLPHLFKTTPLKRQVAARLPPRTKLSGDQSMPLSLRTFYNTQDLLICRDPYKAIVLVPGDVTKQCYDTMMDHMAEQVSGMDDQLKDQAKQDTSAVMATV